jgi:hypothetical protein
MALPMDDPYRGYAAVTHDTNRIAEVIEELNTFRADVTASDTAQNTNLSNHAAGDGHAGIYQPSVNQYYLDSVNGNGGSSEQTIVNNTTTLLDLGTATVNNGGGFNAGADTYTTPVAGTYACYLSVRLADSHANSGNVGLQVHTSSTMDHYTRWYQYVAGGGSRATFDYFRIATWSSSAALKCYMYQDTGIDMTLTLISLYIYRIG